MKITLHPLTNNTPKSFPKLLRDRVTGQVYLAPSKHPSTTAVCLQSGYTVTLGDLWGNLEELPAGYGVTLTNE